MTNQVYPKFRERLVDWTMNPCAPAGLQFGCLLVNDGYTFNQIHESLGDLEEGDAASEQVLLTGVSYPGGVLHADPVVFHSIDTDSTLKSVIIFVTDGESTWLAWYGDKTINASLPKAADAPDGTVRWSANGICRF